MIMWIIFLGGVLLGIVVTQWFFHVGLRALVKKGKIKVLDND